MEIPSIFTSLCNSVLQISKYVFLKNVGLDSKFQENRSGFYTNSNMIWSLFLKKISSAAPGETEGRRESRAAVRVAESGCVLVCLPWRKDGVGVCIASEGTEPVAVSTQTRVPRPKPQVALGNVTFCKVSQSGLAWLCPVLHRFTHKMAPRAALSSELLALPSPHSVPSLLFSFSPPFYLFDFSLH